MVKRQLKDYSFKQTVVAPVRATNFIGEWNQRGFSQDDKNRTSARLLAGGFSSTMKTETVPNKPKIEHDFAKLQVYSPQITSRVSSKEKLEKI